IIEPTKLQYVHLGDPSSITDNIPFQTTSAENVPPVGLPGSPDDRWIFTEENPNRELGVASALATAARVMKGFNDTLASQSLQIAQELWNNAKETNPMSRVDAAVELYLTTKDKEYADFLIQHTNDIANSFGYLGWSASKVIDVINDNNFKQ